MVRDMNKQSEASQSDTYYNNTRRSLTTQTLRVARIVIPSVGFQMSPTATQTPIIAYTIRAIKSTCTFVPWQRNLLLRPRDPKCACMLLCI
jgi:hypothetical protein